MAELIFYCVVRKNDDDDDDDDEKSLNVQMTFLQNVSFSLRLTTTVALEGGS